MDILVAGVGTGGTLTGTGEYLKEKNPAIQVVAVEPQAFAPSVQGTERKPRNSGNRGETLFRRWLNRDIY